MTTPPASQAFPVKRNTFLLAAALTCLSGMVQLAVAVATITLVLVTGIEGILGLGPAIFLLAGALAAFPAGRLMDAYGRVPVLAGGCVAGIAGCLATAAGCAVESTTLELQAAQAAYKSAPEDNRMNEHRALEAAKNAYKRAMRDYKALPEEEDAFEVGSKVFDLYMRG